MKQSNVQAVLFDLDGTLLDTDEMIWAGYRHVFSKYRPDYQLQEKELLEVLGPPLKDIFPRYFEQDVSLLVAEYRAHCATLEAKDYVFLFAEVKETLESLHQRGYKMGIVTTKFVQGAKEGLVDFGLDHYFDVIIGLDSVSQHKPHPEGVLLALETLGVSPENAIFVGDNATDIEAGNQAGVKSIGIGWSRKGVAHIEQANPYTMIGNMARLLDVIKEIDNNGKNSV